jgi:hypothetical protein
MQYVIKCRWGSYYTGPNTNYVFKMGYWNASLNKATVFDCLEQAKDIYKNLKDVYPHSRFLILEYCPATTGKVILSEKDTLIEALQEINNRINSGDMMWYQVIQGISPNNQFGKFKFIKENVND